MSVRPNIGRPDVPLQQLLLEAAQLGVVVELVADVDDWPLWPPDHPFRASSCERKSPYLYVEGAVAAAIEYARTRGLALRVYPCPLGVHYHLSRLRAWVEPEPLGAARNDRPSGPRKKTRRKRRKKARE